MIATERQHGQPIDYFELEQHRLRNLANSVTLAITEGFGDYVDTREWQQDDPSFGFGRVGSPILYTSLNDRDDGKYLPIFQTQMDLAAIRAEARNVTAMSGGVMGAIGTLSNYTLGGGLKFTAQKAATCPASIPPEAVDRFISEAQAVIDRFLRENKFQSDMDREIDSRTREDGEAFVELCVSPAGQIRASFDEPDMIIEPNGSDRRVWGSWLQEQDPQRYSLEWAYSWSFGIHCVRRTPDDPLGYFVRYSPDGMDEDYVPASRMLHVKRNVPRNVKRGVSDLYWIANDVQREAKIRRNTADGAALQAAIAWFREHAAGTTSAAVQSMSSDASVATRYQRTTTGTRPTKQGKLRSGTVVDIPESMKVLPGPMGSERNANFILIAQYVARAIASRWAMPEFMFTSDASNANYASTLVAESPFVKARETDQRFYGSAFVELLWKVLRLAHEIGRAFRNVEKFDELMQVLEITAQGPRVSNRDEYQTVQRQQIEIAMGTLSVETAAAEMGRDLAKEQEKGAHPQTDVGAATAEVPQTDTPVEGGVPVDPLAVDVAATAMNGAQVSSLVDLISQVVAGTLPAESAIVAMSLAFPTISTEQARAMIEPAAAQSGVAPTIGPDGKPIPGSTATVSSAGAFVDTKRSDFTNNMKATNDALNALMAGGSEIMARATLDRLGWSPAHIDGMIADAKDGTIDTPVPEQPEAQTPEVIEEVGSSNEALERTVMPDPDYIPKRDPALVEQDESETEVTPEKKPDRDFPKGVMTQQEIVDMSQKALDQLYDTLADKLAEGAKRPEVVGILKKIDEVQSAAQQAALLCGMLTPFKPGLQDAKSADESPVKPEAAVVNTEEQHATAS